MSHKMMKENISFSNRDTAMDLPALICNEDHFIATHTELLYFRPHLDNFIYIKFSMTLFLNS